MQSIFWEIWKEMEISTIFQNFHDMEVLPFSGKFPFYPMSSIFWIAARLENCTKKGKQSRNTPAKILSKNFLQVRCLRQISNFLAFREIACPLASQLLIIQFSSLFYHMQRIKASTFFNTMQFLIWCIW